MKRVFYQTKIYDYSTLLEADKHIKEMKEKGWNAKRKDDGDYVFYNGQDEFPCSVEYFKEC